MSSDRERQPSKRKQECIEDEGNPTKRSNVPSSSRKTQENDQNFFQNMVFLVIPAGIGNARSGLFKKQITKYEGSVVDILGDSVTHIIVDDKMDYDRLCRILKTEPPKSSVIVKTIWLSNCIREKRTLEEHEYKIVKKDKKESCIITPKVESNSDAPKPTSSSQVQATDVEHTVPKVGVMYHSYQKSSKVRSEGSDADSDYVASGDEDVGEDHPVGGTSGIESTDSTPSTSSNKRPLPVGSWACAQASSSKRVNHNKHITDKLEALCKIYESTNDRWRALGYQKAVGALKRHPKQVTTFEEAQAIQGIGAKLANKIWEIIESGELRKLEELSSNEDIKAMELFTNIWGAGAATARAWVSQGFRTLEDLKERGNLTRHQKIGLQYYDDLLDRMPREEAGEIEQVVIEATLSINPGLTAMACGSYRRGKQNCGDVDVLITHPDGKSHRGIFHLILNKLKETGFLTDDLVSQEENGNQKKYMGICKLPGENRKHRRLDIIVVPYEEFACALMYFTGSAHFNRSMRHLAGKMNMSLSEHSLNSHVVRQGGEKLNKGTPLPTPTEESVFQHLGLKYRPPEERDH